jgi:hypothetical protein
MSKEKLSPEKLLDFVLRVLEQGKIQWVDEDPFNTQNYILQKID